MSISKNQFKLISSLSQKKYRTKHKLFIAEGVKVVDEILSSSFQVHSLFCTNDYYTSVKDDKVIRISEITLKKIKIAQSCASKCKINASWALRQ